MPLLSLGIETSCDDCSASVVRLGDQPFSAPEVLSLTTASQVEVHQPFGGVVPEVASRNHLRTINPVINAAIEQSGVKVSDLDCVGVTNRPGLAGALLVGVTAAKSFAYANKTDLVDVHHLEGHICSAFLDLGKEFEKVEFPSLIAVISGGHSNLYAVPSRPESWKKDMLATSLVARSRDDAAGEAFDKTAKLMGLPYPGGKWIDEKSEGGDPEAFKLPRPLPDKKILDFSFSGLKTAVALKVRELESAGKLQSSQADLCASIQEAIVDSLVKKISLAQEKYFCKSVILVGGVSANRRLRELLKTRLSVKTYFPELKYCTDNGAMIAAAAAFRYRQGYRLTKEETLKLNAIPNPRS